MQLQPVTIALRDQTTTYVYNPRGTSDNVVNLMTSGVSGLSSRRISLAFSPSSAKRATDRVEISLDLPVTAIGTDNIEKVIGKGLFKGYFVIPSSFTAAMRKELLDTLRSALYSPAIASYVDDLDPMWV